MNHGVLFEVDGIPKHSLDHFELLFSPLPIPFPKPKTKYGEIEGGHGNHDYTETFGKVFFNNRRFTLTFTCNDSLRYDSRLSEIANFLHGRVVKMTFYFDELYYYVGRLTINDYKSSRAMGTIVMDVETEPFKYKQLVTIARNTVTEKAVINYENDRMEVTPVFKATENMTFEFNGNSYALGTTETIFPDIEFTQGDNVIVWHGNGVVEVTYQEGSL